MKKYSLFILFFILTYCCNAQMFNESESIIKDTNTNLLWEDTKEAKSIKRTFKQANDYCKNLELDGHKNWKVPGFMPLFSLVDTKVYNPTLSKKFKYFVSDNYWTSKTFGHATSGEAFVINFLSGAFNRELMEDKFFVRCYKILK
ncbi:MULTISPECIES: Lcl C-terminal domain-containing protein [Arcobacteraceae]|uniref:Lcl C-terminal domain-containing protein n=1 Tax=Poseidonibacter parvus TaxID=1850254 RepID=A0A1P8KL15_9BACT|nr:MULTISPECIES: DUF1566 domain-containing protein [Arcobacteraceae]APW65230.1 hypothetical protein LPB137_04910 [Poseidonibacter parvus]